MRVRRCCLLWLEPREEVAFELDALLAGGNGLRVTRRWLALAPHLQREIEVDALQREALGRLSPQDWIEVGTPDATLRGLIENGLVLREDAESAPPRVNDDSLRAGHWHPLAALLHGFGRWSDVDAEHVLDNIGTRRLSELAERLGAAPSERHVPIAAGAAVALPQGRSGDLQRLLERRVTCRNWNRQRALPLELLAGLLQSSYAALADYRAGPGISLLKKPVPSGGGLHPTEAYLLLRRTEGVDDGLYHYDCVAHALRRLPAPHTNDWDALALRLLGGQRWFAGAAVLLFHVCRFRRSFWKYRAHAKAYRATVLDVGHLSQTLYLAATEVGLGAFVTAAINEVEAEQAFGLDPWQESPLAVSGFGWRGTERVETEFDPLGRIWPE